MTEFVMSHTYAFLPVLAFAIAWATNPASEWGKASGLVLSGLVAVAGAVCAAWMVVTLGKGVFPPLRWESLAPEKLIAGIDNVSIFVTTVSGAVAAAVLTVSLLWLIWISSPVKSALQTLFPTTRIKSDGPWVGAFMAGNEIGDLIKLKTGLPLGLFDGKIVRYCKNDKRGWLGGHHAVISATRGGKGVSAVIPAIFDHDGPVLAIDIKGELVDTTRSARVAKGQKVIPLDPFSVSKASRIAGEKRLGFNPLSFIRAAHRNRDSAIIADGLVVPETGNASHFSDRARACLQTTIEVVHELDGANATLHTVRSLISSATYLETLEHWTQNPALANGRAAELAGSLLTMSEKERGSILSTVSKSMEWTSADEMRGFLGVKKGFNLERLLSGDCDVFIVVPLDQVVPQTGFMRLMSNLLLALLVQQDSRRPATRPVLFVADEITRLGYLAKVVDIATVAAGLKLEAIFVLQDRGSLDAIYKEQANTILGSCATIRIFNLGRGDTGTAEWAARLSGAQTLRTESVSSSTGTAVTGATWSETKEPLLSSDKFLEMPVDEMVCFIRGKRPLKLKRIIWYERPEYSQASAENPQKVTPGK